MNIDERRRILEELSGIEEALVNRIKKSSQWVPKKRFSRLRHEKRLLSTRDRALRRWEAAKLVNRYAELRNAWSKKLEEDSKTVSTLDLDSDLALAEEFDDTLPAEVPASQYRLKAGERGRGRLVSSFTSGLLREFDTQYPVKENWGQILDLEPFYNELIAAHGTQAPSTYRDYLAELKKWAPASGKRLREYLEQFYDRTYSFGPGTETAASDLLERLSATVSKTNSQAGKDTHVLYCTICQREFSNQAVFNAHLSGKKHKRAAESVATVVPDETAKIEALLNGLSHVIENSIADIDRKAGITAQERLLEIDSLERERAEEDDWVTDSEGDENEVFSESVAPKALLGPDGTPIPRWLYKLQGLGTKFRCEICGPNAFSGRRNFEKHFQDQRHIMGLAKLGIVYSDAFKGIATISEAKELQKSLQLASVGKTNAEREVEDDEGNVMSEKLYEDLKKQGLI